MQKQRSIIALILVLVVAAVVVLIQLPLSLGLDLRGGAQLTIQVKPTETVTEVTPENLNDVKRVLENRVNGLGVAEPIVQTAGADKILVQLPGVSDPQQAERVLGGTAQLEFREQVQESSPQELQIRLGEREQVVLQQALLQNGEEPDEEALAEVREELNKVNDAIAELFKSVGLGGKRLTNAAARPTQSGNQWEVAIDFDGEGGQKFAELTKKLAGTGRSIGIFLDDALINAPTVAPEYAATGISGGRATISGGFTLESANDLAVQLRGGALPFPVEVVENRTVGATLGRESINRSIVAGLAGLALVFVFMVIYYRLPGALANVALAIYTLLTLACYSLIGVTLTLPGIAGFILSIGMAVDANVLIFERTREELRDGKTLYRSVESGFYRAFSSILDSNVTTLIACAALGYLGSGLVRGFAVTLAIGVLVSMFTALTCSRTLMLLVVLGIPGVRQKPELFCPNLPVPAKS
ncbi:protein translocase subunit SecD [Lusitaniella coriacea LEGE 07157]|uniref:Protein translocase subunit SecD n=1 Tax=Lusitaniella coriacea LEGE 07157 TaxID=945747 RepID=A0A8J7JBH5_9CYAN|nr:protein translocase subunit SecD [Lusitaniella coriacea]MBE9116980.1 protein translocase subunit SecD [Lusitaniella coriacea LEGE 07157]